MKTYTGKTQTHLIIALTFAALMLMSAYLVGDHKQSGTMLIMLIGAYTIISGLFVDSQPSSCRPE